MCDYSLMGLPNRLAVKEEELVVHRFPTGSLGLAAPSDLAPADSSMGRPKSFWAIVKSFLNPPAPPSVRAVCIPPWRHVGCRGYSRIRATGSGSRPDRISDVHSDHGATQPLCPG
jgi:hypothetical protein